MVDGVARLTWAGLARRVERMAHGLRAHGVEAAGSSRASFPTGTSSLLVFLAATRLGAIVHPIPPTNRGSELRFMLNLLESQVLVIPARFRNFDYAAMVAGLRAETPRLERVFIARGAAPAGMEPFAALTDTAWESRAGRARSRARTPTPSTRWCSPPAPPASPRA